MKFEPGDIVRYHDGKVDWEVVHRIEISGDLAPHGTHYYIIKSGMSGRTYTAWPSELRPWRPGER